MGEKRLYRTHLILRARIVRVSLPRPVQILPASLERFHLGLVREEHARRAHERVRGTERADEEVARLPALAHEVALAKEEDVERVEASAGRDAAFEEISRRPQRLGRGVAAVAARFDVPVLAPFRRRGRRRRRRRRFLLLIGVSRAPVFVPLLGEVVVDDKLPERRRGLRLHRELRERPPRAPHLRRVASGLVLPQHVVQHEIPASGTVLRERHERQPDVIRRRDRRLVRVGELPRQHELLLDRRAVGRRVRQRREAVAATVQLRRRVVRLHRLELLVAVAVDAEQSALAPEVGPARGHRHLLAPSSQQTDLLENVRAVDGAAGDAQTHASVRVEPRGDRVPSQHRLRVRDVEPAVHRELDPGRGGDGPRREDVHAVVELERGFAAGVVMMRREVHHRHER
eukprot:31502-Pelagococcus_subviridis.AAC.26